MEIKTTTNIDIDFYDKKYILINAKQYDKNSRFLSITCYNNGELCSFNEGEHSAYIRYKKADNYSVFNSCAIDYKGKIIVELTEQMLAVDGISCADLVIVNKGDAEIDVNTGEVVYIKNASILSSMPIHIDVTGTATENSDIESSYEFNGLNTALEKAEAEYTEVIKTSKSWAVGGTGIRDGEETNNAKYWSEQSSDSADASNDSATSASNSADRAQSYAVGGTGTRENEDTDNAHYYYEMVKSVVDGLNSGFIPIGTISFSELATAEKATGFTYNISDDFITDETFREGSGKAYTAGTNVYWTADEYWDCFGGAASPTATVDEVKTYLGINEEIEIV